MHVRAGLVPARGSLAPRASMSMMRFAVDSDLLRSCAAGFAKLSFLSLER